MVFSLKIYSQNIEIGGRIGSNISKFNYASAGTKDLVRPIIAFNVEYNFNSHWSTDMSLGYTGKGGGDFEQNDKLYVGIEDLKTKLDYLTITFLVRYYLKKESALKPFLTLGPSIGYIISASQFDSDIKDNLRNKIDVSSIFGVGIKKDLSNNLSVEFLGGVDRGWSKIIRAQNESLFNNSFWITIGVKKNI